MKQVIERYYPYFPMIGLIGFLILFVIATTLYPGGSLNDSGAEGHSYFHNYICDLMSLHLPEGEINRAEPYAVVAHFLLSFGMISFFYILPEIFVKKTTNTKIVRILGMLTMTIFIFMYTSYHDTVVLITGILGSITLLVYFMELHRHHPDAALKTLSYVCGVLSISVFLSYQTKIGAYYTPLLQKIAFVVDAVWVFWVSILVASMHRDNLNKTLKAY
jgi:hypothetical protein